MNWSWSKRLASKTIPDIDEAVCEAEARQKPIRLPLPDHLERDTQEHMPNGGICDCCGEDLHRIGEDITEVLDYVPASIRRIKTDIIRASSTTTLPDRSRTSPRM